MAQSNDSKEFIDVVIRGRRRGRSPLPALTLRLGDWQAEDFSLAAFDRAVDLLAARAGDGPIAIRLAGRHGDRPADLAAASRQIAARCQRLGDRRNTTSRGPAFERIRAAHRDLHELEHAAEAAAHAHALDTWQWLLRLDPDAGLAAQLAALLHDLEHPAARRRAAGAQQGGQDGQAGWLADEILAEHEIDWASRIHVHQLIAGLDHHDRALAAPPAAHGAHDLQGFRDSRGAREANLRGAREANMNTTVRGAHTAPDTHRAPGHPAARPAGDAALLACANALSALALASARWVEDLEPAEARRRIAAALACIHPSCRSLLAGLRLPAAVASQVAASLTDAEPSCPEDTAAALAGRSAVLAGTLAWPEGATRFAAFSTTSSRRTPPAVAMIRARMSAGLLGAAGFARTRTSALLRRAAAVGTLMAPARAHVAVPADTATRQAAKA